VAGLPPPPGPLPLPGLPPPPAGFSLRRLESTCRSHAALRRQLQQQLELLEAAPGAWDGPGGCGAAPGGGGAEGQEEEEDGEEEEGGAPGSREEAVARLRQRLQQLGPSPARLALPAAEELRLRQEAEERVGRGDCGVQVGGQAGKGPGRLSAPYSSPSSDPQRAVTLRPAHCAEAAQAGAAAVRGAAAAAAAASSAARRQVRPGQAALLRTAAGQRPRGGRHGGRGAQG
jgi:hypothetical protein